jgi:hypothetical protein
MTVFGDPRLPERFWAKVVPEPNTGCWIWTASTDGRGYGHCSDGHGKTVHAYRLAYETLVGPVPEGLELDHVRARGCVGRACVNPAHLEPVTHQENVRRGDGWSGRHARATHCPAGHPYDEANTYVDPRGKRQCRQCQRASDAAVRAREALRKKDDPKHRPRNADKTHCIRGHVFDAANTYVDPDGSRHCRMCRRATDRARRMREAAKEDS